MAKSEGEGMVLLDCVGAVLERIALLLFDPGVLDALNDSFLIFWGLRLVILF